MNAEEIAANIGTIANSGTRKFLEELQKRVYGGRQVTVITRRAGGDEAALKWESTGDGTYTLEPAERDTFGTDIILHLSEGKDKYLKEWTIREIIKNEEVLNSMKAIWTRSKSEVTDEEYSEFYKAQFHDYQDPAEVIHYKAEGNIEFNALLYLPGKQPFDMFSEHSEHGVQLYVKRVFIMDKCKDLLPPYLRFVKGVVDSSDLPLNVSREILQEDALIRKIQKNLVKRILKTLAETKEKDLDKYLAFYEEFGRVIRKALTAITKTVKNSRFAVVRIVQKRRGQTDQPQGLRRQHAPGSKGDLLHLRHQPRSGGEFTPARSV
ncbi:chaperone protein HtpG-like [Penaeus monodon]|uniref:chaperone protein HtpG-like n=1 Tax=Penaeus monodon TaxID=6687 RepID=UPI0018A723A7|nr:chaperone protein HtpG-like [Penaeus monodon]